MSDGRDARAKREEGRFMEYVVGLVLSLAVGGFATIAGFERDRSFFPTVLIVTASFYVLFATMATSGRPLAPEILAGSFFAALAVIGFKRNLWLVVAGTVGHGAFDLVHHHLIENGGVPSFWPGFCLAFDVCFGAWVAFRLREARGVGAIAGVARARAVQ